MYARNLLGVAAIAALILPSIVAPSPVWAKTVTASPADYKAKLKTLAAGDVLKLSAGTYPLLAVSDLKGTASDWITIRGPASGAPAVIAANPCCNVIELTRVRYLALENLTVDGKDNGGSFGVSAKGGGSNEVAHVRVENCRFINFGGHQYQVAISTKTPTSGWIIRGNTILGAGTGIYLGNSNGNEPFVGGLIEGNLVKDPLGYCIQVKWQKPRPANHPALPSGRSETIIRHNVLIKDNNKTSTGARPNLLVGGFPQSGAGKDDLYQIYGNLIVNNPFEYLLQASGRVVIHDNILVGAKGTALGLRNHDLPLSVARVFNNTIYGGSKGISVSGSPTEARVVGNLIFAAAGISGATTDKRDNLVATVAQAASYVASPSLILGQMDFYPLTGACEGSPLDLSAFASDVDYDVDFNGQSKGALKTRGAYASSGQNPGWALAAEPKPLDPPQPSPDAGVVEDGGAGADGGVGADQGPLPGDGPAADGGATVGDASADSGASAGGDDGGCHLAAGASARGGGLLVLLLLGSVFARRRRR